MLRWDEILRRVAAPIRRRPAVASTLIAAACLAASPAAGQEGSEDVVELTLEEILETPLIPLDVMGSHIHLKGEWMVGYHYHWMDMAGNRDGTEDLTVEQVLAQFPVTPVEMTTETHMVEVMYGVTDRVTLMGMVPYHRKEMDHRTRNGTRFTTVSEGVGDAQAMVHVLLDRSGPHWWILGAAVGLSTGSIDERDDTPAGPDQKLPYPMQLGSGSYDAIPMLNYIYQGERWLSAFHLMGRFSLEENDNLYTVGDRYHLTYALVGKLSDWFWISFRLNGMKAENYEGGDPDLDPAMVHTADPNRRAYEKVTALGGFNLYVNRGPFAGSRFLFEAGRPVYESLEGPQLSTDLVATVAWQWTF